MIESIFLVTTKFIINIIINTLLPTSLLLKFKIFRNTLLLLSNIPDVYRIFLGIVIGGESLE